MINPKRKGTVLKTVSNADSLDVWGCKILIIRHLIYGELAESGLKQLFAKESKYIKWLPQVQILYSPNLIFISLIFMNKFV